MRIHFICNNYYWEGMSRVKGGIETYIWQLSQHLSQKDTVTIWQKSKKAFSIHEGSVQVIGTGLQSFHKILPIVEDDADLANDLLIFSSHYHIVKNHFQHSIAIQHGIAWDVPADDGGTWVNSLTDSIMSFLRGYKTYLLLRNCSDLVCVDYNFLCYYRTIFKHITFRYTVIPNFSIIPEYVPRSTERPVKIIFARRLEPYRGTRIFSEAIIRLLDAHPGVQVTIAGYGPDLEYLKEKLKHFDNISFLLYNADESVKIHQEHDIAVVPSIGSEGTSLSLIEAMAAGCAVVATNVGGITNTLLDEYNGLLVNPDADSIYGAMDKLVSDDAFRKELSKRAYNTVAVSFSYDKWIRAWDKVIEKAMDPVCADD